MVQKNNTVYLWVGVAVFAIIVITIVFIYINSSSSNETKFVCSDGSIVSSQSLCPKETPEVENSQTQQPQTQQNIVKEKVVIYESLGKIDKSVTSKFEKQMQQPDGGTYWVYQYKGGEIEMTFSASSTIKYQLTMGGNCITNQGTTILKEGMIKEGVVTWSPTNTLSNEPCIRLENPNFVDWNNINPVTYSLVVRETQIKSE